MRAARIATYTVWIAVLAGCSSMKVETDWNREARFAGLRTYSWIVKPAEAIPDTRRARREAERRAEIERRIVGAVDRELAGKGYELASDGPDFLIAFYAAAEDTVDVTRVVSYWGYADPWILTHDESRYYKRGALVLDVVDPRKNEVIWRGWATAALDDPALDEVEKKVNEAVGKILARFPPKQ